MLYKSFIFVILINYYLVCGVKIIKLGQTKSFLNKYEASMFWFEDILSQCPRTDLNKRFLPKPMTTTG